MEHNIIKAAVDINEIYTKHIRVKLYVKIYTKYLYIIGTWNAGTIPRSRGDFIKKKKLMYF